MNYFRAEIRQTWGKTLLLSAVLLFSFHIFANKVLAETNPTCPSVYGVACPSGQIFVDKKVQNPKSGEFVDALGTTDVTFAPDQEVNFRIEVKNIGSTGLTQVFAQDRFPGNINFISGPGTFDQNTSVLSWTIDSLGAGESKFFQVKVKVKSQSELQFDIACMTNFVQVQKDQQMAQDTSVFCIQAQALGGTSTIINSINTQSQSQSQTVNVTQTKNVGVGTSGQILGVTQLPKTGLPAAAWLLSGLVPLGFKLRKFTASLKGEEGNASYIYQMREFLKEGGDRI